MGELREQLAELKAAKEPDALMFAPAAISQEVDVTMTRVQRPERKLGGFMKSSTTNAKGVGCYEFSGGSEIDVDLSSATCKNSLPCPHCFVATSLSADINLDVSDCQAALIKSGLAMNTGATHVLELVFINMDGNNKLTIRGCTQPTCTSPVNTYVLGPGESVVGYCYTGGASAINFPNGPTTCPAGCDAAAPVNREGATFSTIVCNTADNLGAGSANVCRASR